MSRMGAPCDFVVAHLNAESPQIEYLERLGRFAIGEVESDKAESAFGAVFVDNCPVADLIDYERLVVFEVVGHGFRGGCGPGRRFVPCEAVAFVDLSGE